MSDIRIQDDANKRSATSIAEGLPPEAPAPTMDSRMLTEPNIQTPEPAARQVFLAWEKWRILLNVLVIVIGWMFITPHPFMVWNVVVDQFIQAILYTNLCHCVGPLIEGYLCWFGMARHPARVISLLIIGAVCLVIVATCLKSDIQDRIL